MYKEKDKELYEIIIVSQKYKSRKVTSDRDDSFHLYDIYFRNNHNE